MAKKNALEKLDKMILATPTGTYRNKLTSLNMVMMAIDNDMNPRHLEAMINSVVTEPAEKWHHPGTEKTGHRVSECVERGCKTD